MTNPFFSVVIPTKNRIEPLKTTLESILAQEFPDFECVIVDNNDDNRLDGLCESYGDSRLRRVRTGGLHMADNWDAALRAAQGQYVILIEDKQCLYGHALLVAHEIILKTGADALHWGGDVLEDLAAPFKVGSAWGTRSLQLLSSDDILEQFTFQKPHLRNGKMGYAYYLITYIVGCRSVVRRSLLEDIRKSTGLKICLPVNPSFTMGCHLLNRLESYYHFDGSMSLFHSAKVSTGGNLHLKKQDINNFWKEIGGLETGFRYSPIKCYFNEGAHCNDYLAMTELLGGRLARHPMNWVIYYTLMYELNIRNHWDGLDRSDELKAWRDALRLEPWRLQLQVNLQVLAFRLKRIFKTVRSKSGLRRLEKLVKGKPQRPAQDSSRQVSSVREFVVQETARLREIDAGNFDLGKPKKQLSVTSSSK